MKNNSALRLELNRTKSLVLSIFDGRCIMCGCPTREVHEILPISHGRRALAVANRVPLCGGGSRNNHHDWAHRIGTRVSIPILQEKRAEFLRRKWEKRLGKTSLGEST